MWGRYWHTKANKEHHYIKIVLHRHSNPLFRIHLETKEIKKFHRGLPQCSGLLYSQGRSNPQGCLLHTRCLLSKQPCPQHGCQYVWAPWLNKTSPINCVQIQWISWDFQNKPWAIIPQVYINYPFKFYVLYLYTTMKNINLAIIINVLYVFKHYY